MMEKFSKEEFTLRDMYEQFENVMKLAPVKVMAMIPGIQEMGEGDEGGNRLKWFAYTMDSRRTMSSGSVDLNRAPSRRIAAVRDASDGGPDVAAVPQAVRRSGHEDGQVWVNERRG